MTAFITRDISNFSEFQKLLAAAGWQVTGHSLVALAPLPFRAMPDCDWIFFSSKNAVRFFFQNIENQNIDLPKSKWAALGQATAKVLAEYVGKVDFVGTGEPKGTAVGFRRFLAPRATPPPAPPLSFRGGAGGGVERGAGSGSRILFPAARHSRQSVMSLLAPDFHCAHFEIYDNQPIAEPPFSAADVLVFTSPMNAEAYFSKYILGEKQRVVAIGATTAGALRELGVAEIKIAAEPTEKGLAEAVLRLQG